jgi:hypothetical protein
LRQANTKNTEAEASKCTDNVSERSTDHGFVDSAKFALDGDSLDTCKSSHADDVGIRAAGDDGILDQGFGVAIKNTFLMSHPSL